MPDSGPGSCASPSPEDFCAWKITSKKHSSQGSGERMLGFPTPSWSCSPKTHSHRDPAVCRRSLKKLMESALSVIFIWVALISPHSPVCGDAVRLRRILREWAPSSRQWRAGSRKGGRCGSGTVGLIPWPKSNTKPRWTCSHYERKRQSLQVRLQGKKVVMFSFSLFPLFSFFQKFLVVIKVKSLSFCSCHCKCSFFRFTRFHSSKKITNWWVWEKFFFLSELLPNRAN